VKSIYAVHRPVVNAYLVRERDRRFGREVLRFLLVVVPVAVALVVCTWVHMEVARTGYRIGVLERDLDRLEQEERRLRLEASYLADPTRLETRASAELGMRAPTLEQMVFAGELAPPVPPMSRPRESR
jgi:cell division protein FtsL